MARQATDLCRRAPIVKLGGFYVACPALIRALFDYFSILPPVAEGWIPIDDLQSQAHSQISRELVETEKL